MKSILITILVLACSVNSNAQEYISNYKADMCECIQACKTNFVTINRLYDNCFLKHMVTYAPFIDAEINEENKTQHYIKGQHIRKELKERFKYELIYTCDTYLNIIEHKRKTTLQQFRNKKIDSLKLNTLNQSIAMQPNWPNYFNRGQYYYYIGALKKAEQDILKCIKENPLSVNNVGSLNEKILLASIYEEQKQYEKALTIYNQINATYINSSIEILKAIVVRKSKGYAYKAQLPAQTTNDSITKTDKPQTPKINENIKKKWPNTVSRTTRNSQNKDTTKSLRKLFKLKS